MEGKMKGALNPLKHFPIKKEKNKRKKPGGNKTAALKTACIHHIYYQFNSLEWKLQVLW